MGPHSSESVRGHAKARCIGHRHAIFTVMRHRSRGAGSPDSARSGFKAARHRVPAFPRAHVTRLRARAGIVILTWSTTTSRLPTGDRVGGGTTKAGRSAAV